MTFEVHPLAELIPAMTEAEFAELREDIREHGQREPITLYEDKVLDGRHRARACDELGIEPTTREYEGDAPAAFVISLNVKRRNLTVPQLARIAVQALPALEEEAAERSKRLGRELGGRQEPPVPSGTGGDQDTKRSRAAREAGALVGVSARTVARAKRVQDEAPDLAEEMWAERISITAADEAVARRKAAQEPAPKDPPALGPESRPHGSRRTYRELFAMTVGEIRSQMDTLDPDVKWKEGAFVPESVRLFAQDADELAEWIKSLRKSREALHRFIKALESEAS